MSEEEEKQKDRNLKERHFHLDIQVRQSILLDTYLLVISSGFIVYIFPLIAEEKPQCCYLIFLLVMLIIPIITIVFVLYSLYLSNIANSVSVQIVDNRIVPKSSEHINSLNCKFDRLHNKMSKFNFISIWSFIINSVLFVVWAGYKLIIK
jgi:hypothetical protein